MMRGFTVPGEQREVIHHSIIGGIVAVLLAWSDEAIHAWFHNAFAAHPDWVRALVLFLIFVAGFCAIWLIEYYWQRKARAESNAPLRLKAAGQIDGFWLDAIWAEESTEPIEASITKISSSAEGFLVHGKSYHAAALVAPANLAKVEPVGDFRGNAMSWSDDGISYQYNGQESGSGLDRGVGFYRFWRDPADHQMVRFDGAFLGLNLKQSRFVKGRKVTESELADLNKGLGAQVLQSFLASGPVR